MGTMGNMETVRTIWVLALFPEFLTPLAEKGVVGRAFREGPFELKTILLRGDDPTDFKGVDDAPYGGGQGMVMRADVLYKALEDIVRLSDKALEDFHVIFPSPRGRPWDQEGAFHLSKKLMDPLEKDPIFICGRYEGVDERFVEKYVHQEISVGDYILSGGELATAIILDSALRLCPGVLGHPDSCEQESFVHGCLEHPLYTRPADFQGMGVPEVLVSGHAKRIEEWKRKESLTVTRKYRPDLLNPKDRGK
ncbi:MAG: tRNA (guanosine(37)-N1)-methyltransferase TrmD [Bacteriovoracales bacterium]|nr:tRNA (guanosine(37)-N1)-methyltransferase TrmD [Bacteriovoracales bacterium]